MTDDFTPDDALDEQLRTALATAAPDAPSSGVLNAIERRTRRRRRRVREVIAAGAVAVAGAAVALGVGLSSSPASQMAGPGVAPTTSTTISGQGATAAQAGLHDGIASPAEPCHADQVTPSRAAGSYCGPAPHAGNGSGPNGTCAGSETGPPCGPGAVPGRYYAYTMPGTCTGLITFDGKQWVSELPPPTPEPDFYVWIGLGTNGTPGWISPDGAVGFQPYVGQALQACRS